MNKLIIILGIITIIIWSILIVLINKQSTLNKKSVWYSITIQNEHDVICVHEKDTIILSFENAYALLEETQILIKR